MVSLLATCCGSTQPESEPTAKVRVPPDLGCPVPLPVSPPPDPQAVSRALMVTRAVSAAHREVLTWGSAITEGFSYSCHQARRWYGTWPRAGVRPRSA